MQILWSTIDMHRQDDVVLKDTHASDLSRHFLKEFSRVQMLTIDDVYKANFMWLPVDDVEANLNDKADIASIHGEWREAIAPDGKTYYWYSLVCLSYVLTRPQEHQNTGNNMEKTEEYIETFSS